MELGQIRALAVEDEECGCGTVNYDYSTAAGCDDECGECGEGAGVESCLLVACLSDLVSYTCVDCSLGNVNSGVVTPTSITFNPGTVYRFFARKDSVQFTSNETRDEDGNCTVEENIAFQSKTGNQELCWLRERKKNGSELVAYLVDGCGRVMQVGGEGGLKVTDFTVDTGRVKGDFRGITGSLTNTGCEPFKYVGNFTADADEIMNFILLQ